VRTRFLILAIVLGAAALSSAAGAADRSATPSGTNVLVVMNPSRNAIKTEVRHVKEIFSQVSTLPKLWFLGVYEQRSNDDGPPFDRPFVQASTPGAVIAPDPCSETNGTNYQKSTCRKSHEKTRAENAERLAAWRTQVLAQIESAGRRTEESKRWNLAGALSRAGTNLSAVSAGGTRRNCLVLLGGLAVQPPPTSANLASLAGTAIVVTGWRSTARVQNQWNQLMRSAGATIEFLPADVTDFILRDAVTRCTTPAA
jgi:hypothetical protein